MPPTFNAIHAMIALAVKSAAVCSLSYFDNYPHLQRLPLMCSKPSLVLPTAQFANARNPPKPSMVSTTATSAADQAIFMLPVTVSRWKLPDVLMLSKCQEPE